MEQQLPNPATNGVSKPTERAGGGFFKNCHSFFVRTCNRYPKSYAGLRWVLVMFLRPSSTMVWAFVLKLWALGIRRLLWDRQWATGAENRWSFGQVLPLLLVILPFFIVIEVFQGETNHHVEFSICPHSTKLTKTYCVEASTTEISEETLSNTQNPQDSDSRYRKLEGTSQ